MLKPGDDVDLAEEAVRPRVHGPSSAWSTLISDQTVVAEVLGGVNRGHAAAAELALDRVAVAEGVRD